MKQEMIRTVISQTVVAAGLCSAVYVFAIRPMHAHSALVHAQLEAHNHAVANSDAVSSQMPEIVKQLSAVESQRAAFDARGMLAAHESDAFSTIMALSRQTGLIVDQIVPTEGLSTTKKQHEAADAGKGVHDHHAQYSLTGTGTYNQVVHFVDALESQTGFSQIASCRVSPKFTGNDEKVSFSLTLDLYGFDTTPSTGVESASATTGSQMP